MLEASIVELAASPWSSNIVLVARPGGANPRMTVDFRGLNQITYRDKFPLARISHCQGVMSDSTFFSFLVMSSSFHQIPIDPND